MFDFSPSRFLALPVALLAALFAASPAAAAGEHDGHVAPTAPVVGDARFVPGSVGPVVFRGTAATLTIPDGPGFGGEQGRRQNAGDLRKNNYSVTDANFNNVLGLLPRHPDTGAELTYVQHIQLYAAAGYVEAYAPDTYAHMVMHQNRGEGTVLGAAGFMMGLVRTADPAAHGLDVSSIPMTLPGTTIDARNYVRATRDATGQQWARPHHAQTAPAVYRMLVAAGLPSSAALVLASDDGISGAGRLNGMNEQNGDRDGFNAGERATWAFAAQLQAQSGLPVVLHMMHGHDHAGIDASALTKPKVNALIGMVADDRSTSDARAAALYAALTDGRVATAETAAADQNLTVRNEAYLRPRSTLRVDAVNLTGTDQDVGVERDVTIRVKNDGPHFLRDVALTIARSANVEVVALAGPAGMAGVHCMADAASCHMDGISAEMGQELTLTMRVRFTGVGPAWYEPRVTSGSPVDAGRFEDRDDHDVHGSTIATIGMAARTMGIATSSCGATIRRMCVVRRALGTNLVVSARPGRYEGVDRRKVRIVFQQRVGQTWRTRGDQWTQVAASGLARVRVKPSRLASPSRPVARGTWRVRVEAGEHRLLRGATSAWRYITVG